MNEKNMEGQLRLAAHRMEVGSKDKENLSRVLAANEKRFREVERRAADVIEAITNSGIKYDDEDEVVNVCQAIQEMRKEERQIGELNKAKETAGKLHEIGLDTEHKPLYMLRISLVTDYLNCYFLYPKVL